MLLYIISYFMVGCGMETSDLIVQLCKSIKVGIFNLAHFLHSSIPLFFCCCATSHPPSTHSYVRSSVTNLQYGT